jgi:flagellar motor switch protein FliN/FliY
MNEAPYFWIRKISSHLREYDTVPLFGSAPPFDWDHLSSTLAARLGVQDFTIRKGGQQWRASEDLKDGLGDHILTYPVKIGPLSGSAFWMMTRENIGKLTAWMMNGQIKTKPLSSEILTEGFYRYLILQMLDCASVEGPLQQLSVTLSDASPVPETDAFCIDIEIEFNKQSCWGRLVIDPALQRSWQEHFSEPGAEYIPTKIAQITELTAGIKIGAVRLKSKEWKLLKPGDFVPLDTGTYHPRKETGAAYLTVGKTPLFQVKVKHNKIQLIDYAFMYEEEMNKHHEEPEAFTEQGEAEQFPAAEEETVTLKELPVNLVVEISRLRITLEKLIQLVPGNMIELPIKPDQPVHLTINDQLVGKAELVHLGETLGIRILEIG